MTAVVLRFYRW